MSTLIQIILIGIQIYDNVINWTIKYRNYNWFQEIDRNNHLMHPGFSNSLSPNSPDQFVFLHKSFQISPAHYNYESTHSPVSGEKCDGSYWKMNSAWLILSFRDKRSILLEQNRQIQADSSNLECTKVKHEMNTKETHFCSVSGVSLICRY